MAVEAGSDLTVRLTGTLGRDADDWVYVPVDVPSGVSRLDVEYRYDRSEVELGELQNACDLGVFDERGTARNGPGFRGWSGGSRTGFFISATDATPGYLPGAVHAGRWHVLLAPYQVAPGGLTYTIDVAFTFAATAPTEYADPPRYPPIRLERSPAGRWVRGDCHLHTVYSDGVRSTTEMATAARARGLDFIISTDHNTTAAHRHWAEHAGDDLLIGLGEEVTTRNGHWLALGVPPETWIDWRFRADDDGFAQAAAHVRDVGGIVVAAHPFAPCLGCRFKYDPTLADAIEVWNGPWTPDDEAAVLAWDNLLMATRGRWVAAIGNSDSHATSDVVGLPQTVVEVDDVALPAVLGSLAAGRSWIAESADVSLTFTAVPAGDDHADPTVQATGIGGRLDVAAQTLVDVTTVVDGVPGGEIVLVTDQGVVRRASCGETGHGEVVWRTAPARSRYVRAEVRHAPARDPFALPAPMAAMTNPIFLGDL